MISKREPARYLDVPLWILAIATDVFDNVDHECATEPSRLGSAVII